MVPLKLRLKMDRFFWYLPQLPDFLSQKLQSDWIHALLLAARQGRRVDINAGTFLVAKMRCRTASGGIDSQVPVSANVEFASDRKCHIIYSQCQASSLKI